MPAPALHFHKPHLFFIYDDRALTGLRMLTPRMRADLSIYCQDEMDKDYASFFVRCISVRKKINDEWLSDKGRFFLVCPNANAPSRQIAVKMGLINHNSAVTNAEHAHGHRITYSLDTLERDVTAAGLKVIYRSGIFFKALANFQWDKLLKTDIISPEYLEGCYQLGQQYPDLCSSIFLLCEKG